VLGGCVGCLVSLAVCFLVGCAVCSLAAWAGCEGWLLVGWWPAWLCYLPAMAAGWLAGCPDWLRRLFGPAGWLAALALSLLWLAGCVVRLASCVVLHRRLAAQIDGADRQRWLLRTLAAQGITQGSILGPLLFLIYINDLPNLASTGTKVLLYADDTSIIVTSSNLENCETKLDNIFGDINNWFRVNQLTLNYNKTNYLQFNMKNS